MKRILLIDNYDSFTYNLAHTLEEHKDVQLDVVRNNHIPEDIDQNYDGILLSPGPGIPSEAGSLLECVKYYMGRIPMFGVCLGHQAIVESLGGSLVNTVKVYHGIASEVNNHKTEQGILRNISSKFSAGRYHSWIVNESDLPQELEVTATIEDGTIMAFQHKNFPVYGVQFHPESILTPMGKTIIFNWIEEIPSKN